MDLLVKWLVANQVGWMLLVLGCVGQEAFIAVISLCLIQTQCSYLDFGIGLNFNFVIFVNFEGVIVVTTDSV